MKKILITGISRGIGLATAELFLQKGWAVIGTSTSGLTPLQHPNLQCYRLDLANPQEINSLVAQLPEIDVLVNNAAVLLEDWQEVAINLEELRQTFAINVFGTIELTEQCIPKIHKGGQIINLSSGWGAFSSNDSAHVPHYKMSKSCLNMYTKLLAERLPQLTIASFDPGWVKTDMGTSQGPTLPAAAAKELYDLVHTKKESGYFWHAGKIRPW
jgi:NAD(P)-dependent dehydrogenase (short-subunit alcohol dehydrogenase family)